MLGWQESGYVQQDGGLMVLGLAARRRWVVRKSCTNIRTYCEAPGLVSPLSLSHPAVPSYDRTLFFSLSLTSLPVPSRVGDCFLILDPCHQVRVSSDAYFTVQRSLCVESWIKRVQLITISRVSFERKAAGDKGPVYPRGLNRIRMEETAQIKPA